MGLVTIIAEIGVNHNNNIDVARKLIEVARDAGVDYVKFQAFSANESVSRFAKKAEYQKRNEATKNTESAWEMSKRFEIDVETMRELFRYCQQQGVAFMSSTFDITSAKYLYELGEGIIKIPSGEITNLPLLRWVSQHFSKVIFSTGMSDIQEVHAALAVLEKGSIKKDDIVVLHCNTDYPTAMGDVNLKAMEQLRSELGVSVGYSDHTLGIEVPIAAVALGATVIEKHFTLDRNMPGPDHAASLEPSELKAMVAAIRNIEQALGSDVKQPTPSELKNRDIARKSIVAAKAIAAHELLTEENLAVKRPGDGVSPMRWDEVVGTRAVKDFEPDEQITLG